MKKMTTRHQGATLSLSQIVYGDMSLNRDVELCQGVVRKGRPFVVSGVRKMNSPVSLGRTVELPAPKPDQTTIDDQDQIEVFFDDDEDPTDRVNQEYSGIVAENEFIVDQDEIDKVRDRKIDLEAPIRDAMKEMTALLYANDDAANFVEAAMRDGLGYMIERDSGMEDALIPITRLSVLTSIINNLTSLTDSSKSLLLHKLSSKTADEIMAAFNKRKIPDALAAIRKEYAATIKNAGLEEDAPIDVANTVGVRTSRR